MTITQLKYCIAVAEFRNFTSAAKHVYVTQPTLSMQIQKLEQELDLKIFDRTQKPIALTAVGEKIIQQAHLIVAESERIQDVIQQEKGVIGGSFKLGIIPTVMSTLLPLFLQTILKAYPKLILEIEEMATQQIIEKLEKDYPNINISGSYSPPIGNYEELTEKKYIEDIQKSEPDIIWVSLGFPKQEMFIDLLRSKYSLQSNLVGVGGVFEWVAGTKVKAPDLLQTSVWNGS